MFVMFLIESHLKSLALFYENKDISVYWDILYFWNIIFHENTDGFE